MARNVSRTRIEARIAEIGGRFVEVQAPAHWTAAQLDAWIDWTSGATDLPAAITDHVEELTARAQAKGLVKDVRARTRFRDDLSEALLTGAIAIGGTRHGPPVRVVEIGSPEIARAVAAHRGQLAAEAAALEFGRRMQAVMDAVLRCEGDPEACADPQSNPSLTRAAEAARAIGGSDGLILDAVALARAGERAWEVPAPQGTASGLRLVVIGQADDAVAAAAWATGAILLAPDRARGEHFAAADRAMCGGVNLMGFWTADGFDIDGFESAVALLASALSAGGESRGTVGLAGLGDWLVAHGLDYDSDAARETARELYMAAERAMVGSSLSACSSTSRGTR